MKLKSFIQLIIAIIISELAGVIGSIFTVSAIPTWYAGLVKPTVNPPSWIFGPVWITLYALMGIAAFLVWQCRSGEEESEGEKENKKSKAKRKAIGVFCFQLVLNAAWSIIFFGLHSPSWAFADVVALWFAIVWTMALFYTLSKPAMYLLLPYILWVSFAAYLNYSILLFNR